MKSPLRQNRDNIEALRLKQLANQEIEKSRDFESMEKYRHMGLSEDEAKIHLKREKRAEKVERERRLQIEAEAGFLIFSVRKRSGFRSVFRPKPLI